MKKVSAVVIMYNPDVDVVSNILTYAMFVDRLIIFDNSEIPKAIDVSTLGDKVVLIADCVNKGISERLNMAAKMSMDYGSKWLLTMDQDSFFDEQNMLQYRQCWNEFDNKSSVAMFGVEYEKKPLFNKCNFLETDNLITSGSIVNLDVFKLIGGFDEKLFIDEVDSEYCYRAKVHGFKTIKFEHIYMHHSLGKVMQYRSLKNFNLTPRTLHSPIRLYYMVRNYLYVYDKYHQQLPDSFPYRRKAILNRIKNNLLYGKEKMQVIKYLFLAYKDYKKGKMGSRSLH